MPDSELFAHVLFSRRCTGLMPRCQSFKRAFRRLKAFKIRASHRSRRGELCLMQVGHHHDPRHLKDGLPQLDTLPNASFGASSAQYLHAVALFSS